MRLFFALAFSFVSIIASAQANSKIADQRAGQNGDRYNPGDDHAGRHADRQPGFGDNRAGLHDTGDRDQSGCLSVDPQAIRRRNYRACR